MALKVVFVTVMVLFALGTTPTPMAATRADVAALLSAINFPAAKSEDTNWCKNCVCTRSIPPICFCEDSTTCLNCVCRTTLSAIGQSSELCEDIATQFSRYCPTNVATKATKAVLA